MKKHLGQPSNSELTFIIIMGIGHQWWILMMNIGQDFGVYSKLGRTPCRRYLISGTKGKKV